MPYRPVFVMRGGERATNSQVFESYQEAHDSALARFSVWTAPVDFGADECDAPVNYVRVDGQDKRKET